MHSSAALPACDPFFASNNRHIHSLQHATLGWLWRL